MALCQGTTSQAAEKLSSGGRRGSTPRIRPAESMGLVGVGFTGCGKTIVRREAGFYPPHKASRINGALAPDRRSSPTSPGISSFSAARSLRLPFHLKWFNRQTNHSLASCRATSVADYSQDPANLKPEPPPPAGFSGKSEALLAPPQQAQIRSLFANPSGTHPPP
jgi:hypothetical protein